MASKEAEEYLKKLMSDKTISSTMNPCDEVIKDFDAGIEFEKKKHKWHNLEFNVFNVPDDNRSILVKETSHSDMCYNYSVSFFDHTLNCWRKDNETYDCGCCKIIGWKEIE